MCVCMSTSDLRENPEALGRGQSCKSLINVLSGGWLVRHLSSSKGHKVVQLLSRMKTCNANDKSAGLKAMSNAAVNTWLSYLI